MMGRNKKRRERAGARWAVEHLGEPQNQNGIVFKVHLLVQLRDRFRGNFESPQAMQFSHGALAVAKLGGVEVTSR
jgi:hypothetical protein